MQERLRSSNADFRWPSIGSIHLTLKFLGDVEPKIIPQITELLSDLSVGDRPFELRLSGFGAFPSIRNPRIVWCGIKGDEARLESLQNGVESVCSRLYFPREERPFHPHLTLGRIRSRRNLHRLVDCIKMGFELEHAFKVDRFHIFRSTLKPRGAVYDVLETIWLRGTEAT
jgi:2'-5' RNA ligase